MKIVMSALVLMGDTFIRIASLFTNQNQRERTNSNMRHSELT